VLSISPCPAARLRRAASRHASVDVQPDPTQHRRNEELRRCGRYHRRYEKRFHAHLLYWYTRRGSGKANVYPDPVAFVVHATTAASAYTPGSGPQGPRVTVAGVRRQTHVELRHLSLDPPPGSWPRSPCGCRPPQSSDHPACTGAQEADPSRDEKLYQPASTSPRCWAPTDITRLTHFSSRGSPDTRLLRLAIDAVACLHILIVCILFI
jgi:hypothetical protein